jgi:hypothetical protein
MISLPVDLYGSRRSRGGQIRSAVVSNGGKTTWSSPVCWQPHEEEEEEEFFSSYETVSWAEPLVDRPDGLRPGKLFLFFNSFPFSFLCFAALNF